MPAEAQESFRLIRQHTTTPLAVGEIFNTIHDCYQLIQEQLVDYIRTTVVHAGGISHLRKIASLAELYHVRTGSPWRHRPEPGVHGGGAALRHQRPQLRDSGIHAAHAGDRRGLPARLHVRGRDDVSRATSPGWVWTSTRRLAAKYPYERAYLPVNRKLDGTMHSW